MEDLDTIAQGWPDIVVVDSCWNSWGCRVEAESAESYTADLDWWRKLLAESLLHLQRSLNLMLICCIF